jgi:trehalose-phosphatase
MKGEPVARQVSERNLDLQVQSREDSDLGAIAEILAKVFATRDLFVALDRDGTLVPFAERPEEAFVDKELDHLITKLSRKSGITLGVISARSIAQLRGDFAAKNLFLAGNYGMEIALPSRSLLIQPFALEAVPILKKLRDRLTVSISNFNGAILEDHGYSLCLHWHLVPENHLADLQELILSIKPDFSNLHFSTLNSSYEVKPKNAWSKGHALSQIFSNYQTVLNDPFVFYAGDSEPDEAAFSWVNDRGGLSLKMGVDERPTCAKFHLKNLQSLRLLLRNLLELEERGAKRAVSKTSGQ